MNICVWDAQFAPGCQNSDLLWPLNSLAQSLASLHFSPSLFVIFFFSLSLSRDNAHSLHWLSVSPSSVKSVACMSTCARKHMSATLKPDLALGEFFILCYLEGVQRYKSEPCMPCEGSSARCSRTIIRFWHKGAAFWALIQITKQRWLWVIAMSNDQQK